MAAATVVLCVWTALSFLVPPASASRGGDLDPTFGNQGRVLQPQNARAYSLTKAPDGKLIAAGCHLASCAGTILARYRPDGTLDPTFGTDGRGWIVHDLAPGVEGAAAVALDTTQPDYRIVTAGLIEGKFAIARFRGDGSRDASFGTGGVSLGPDGVATSLTPYGDAWIVSGLQGNDSLIAKFNAATGSPVPGFGGGFVRVNVGGRDAALGVAADSSGIYAVGYADGSEESLENALGAAPERRGAVIRLLHDGSRDSAFDGNGILIGDTGVFTSAILQNAGTASAKLVAAGRLDQRLGLMRFDSEGVDENFGIAGRALGPTGRASALVTEGDALVAAGRNVPEDGTPGPSVPSQGGADILISRFNSEGALDLNFGSQGSVVTDLGIGTGEAAAVVAGPSARVTIAGYSGNASTWTFALARYHTVAGLEQVQLGLTLSAGPDPIEVGGNLVYTLTLSNKSNDMAYAVRLEYRLPVGPEFVSYSTNDGVCGPEAVRDGTPSLICDYGGLPANASRTLLVTVAPTTPGVVTSSAQVSTSSSDGDASDNTATSSTTVVAHEGAYTPAAAMASPRAGHAAVLLKDGRVLVVGGRSDGSTELFDPDTNLWTEGPPLRLDHGTAFTATLLGDGRVLVVGSPEPAANQDTQPRQAEIFDPARPAEGWILKRGPDHPRSGHVAVALSDGRALVMGGDGGPSSTVKCNDAEAPQAGASLKTAEIWNPSQEEWVPVKPMPTGRKSLPPTSGSGTHGGGFTATLLPDGKVLVVGGFKGDPWGDASPQGGASSDPDACDGKGPLAPGEVFDPVSGSWWDSGGPQIARQGHTATLLKNGKVLVAGGNTTVGDVFPTPHAAVFDPTDTSSGLLGTWKNTASLMINDRVNHAAALLENGKILITGGLSQPHRSFPRHPRGAELYDPGTGKFEPAGVTVTRRDHTATALGPGPLSACGTNCGKILVAGGNSTGQVHLPDPANPSIPDPGSPSGLLGPGQGAFPAASADLYTSPPAIDRLDPPEGPLAGNTEVVISGAAFANTTKVTFEGQLPLVCGNKLVARCWVDEELPDVKLHVMTPPRSVPGRVGLTVETLPGMAASTIFRYVGSELPPGDPAGGASETLGGAQNRSNTLPPSAPPSSSAGTSQSLNQAASGGPGPPGSLPPQLAPSQAMPLSTQPVLSTQIGQQAATSAGPVLSIEAQGAYASGVSEAPERESQPAPRYLFAGTDSSDLSAALAGAALAGSAGLGILIACMITRGRDDPLSPSPALARAFSRPGRGIAI